jgi:hypothetical protein
MRRARHVPSLRVTAPGWIGSFHSWRLCPKLPASMALRFACVALFALVFAACFRMETTPRHEADCTRVCLRSAHQCDEAACLRGCNFSLDRLLEHEGPNVLRCVAKAKTCDDRVWATCGAEIGVHADGGPPAPPPAKEWDDEPTEAPTDDENSLE